MTSLRLTAVLLSLWASAAPLRAELMLDDFDDPALTTSPEMENVFVITPNVGGLNAERQIRIATAAANPVARFGADTITESNLVAQLSGVNPTDTGGALMAFQFNYDFAPTDVSQSGANDSILLDFRALHAAGFVPELGLLVWDNTNRGESYFAAIPNLPAESGPYTARIPFASFTQRSGAPGLPDFTTVRRMHFDFFFLYPPTDAQWTAEIERIRFGGVPEPASSSLLMTLMPYVARRTRSSVR